MSATNLVLCNEHQPSERAHIAPPEESPLKKATSPSSGNQRCEWRGGGAKPLLSSREADVIYSHTTRYVVWMYTVVYV
jgi:hypothetical protein